MGQFRPPGNASRMRVSKLRWFDGLGGPVTQVLHRLNQRGWDISNTVVNEVFDLDLGKRGEMKLRAGRIKINSTGKSNSIDGLIFITAAGELAYGVISGGTLSTTPIPRTIGRGQPPITLAPTTSVPAVSSLYLNSDPSVEP